MKFVLLIALIGCIIAVAIIAARYGPDCCV